MGRHMGRLREREESCLVTLSWQFELLLWVISSGFPLANHFDLCSPEAIFGISQDPFMCGAHLFARWSLVNSEEAHG